MRLLLLFAVAVLSFILWGAEPFVLNHGESVRLTSVTSSETPAVGPALEMLKEDLTAVLGTAPKSVPESEAKILIGRIEDLAGLPGLEAAAEDLRTLQGQHEGFLLKVLEHEGQSRLLIVGSDARGTAYGILELSRRVGVSPWTWWADLPPHPLPKLELPADFRCLSAPKVAYRGIFVNDEDWGLTPWAWKTHEPTDIKGRIGPKTHARIFQLLLRLRANTFWPAMHSCTEPFFLTPGNRAEAERYGIVLGSSHCEPMLCNINGEWRRATKAPYDWTKNREGISAYWEARVRETARLDAFYTLGMRGIHDSPMVGPKTPEARKTVLAEIITAQRDLLVRTLRQPVERIPQVFIPYKEVLDIYRSGLVVPSDVTLLWCDDNHGYITHFPNAQERARSGGNGLYYHLSYWGLPHDYLWLATTSPALLTQQLRQAYDGGVRKLWIINVGDIKPAEYLTELAMDLAWDPERLPPERLPEHLSAWFSSTFGSMGATVVAPAFADYYSLAWQRRPEFMTGSFSTQKKVCDLPWSEEEIRERLDVCGRLSAAAQPPKKLPDDRRDAWFQLVEYPLRAFAEMNRKFLTAELARHGKADWVESRDAHENIQNLTEKYNTLNNRKWRYIMDCAPRDLPVFRSVPEITIEASLPKKSLIKTLIPVICDGFAVPGLGYGGVARFLRTGERLIFRPDTGHFRAEFAFVPNQPINDKSLRIRIDISGKEVTTFDLAAKIKSEKWSRNVLRNQALYIKELDFADNTDLVLTALDDGILFDTLRLFSDHNAD